MKLLDCTFDNCKGYLLQRLRPKPHRHTKIEYLYARASNLVSFLEWKLEVFDALGNCEVKLEKESKLKPFKLIPVQ